MTDTDKRSPRSDPVLDQDDRRISALLDRDLEMLDAILDDDLVYTHSSGSVDTKASFIAQIADPQRGFLDIVVHERKLVVSTVDTRTLHGVMTLHLIRPGDQTARFSIRCTSVYVRRDDGWKLVIWHATRLPELYGR